MTMTRSDYIKDVAARLFVEWGAQTDEEAATAVMRAERLAKQFDWPPEDMPKAKCEHNRAIFRPLQPSPEPDRCADCGEVLP